MKLMGIEISPIFYGDAKNAEESIGAVVREYGTKLIHCDSKCAGGVRISWQIDSAPGIHHLWARYASFESRPMRIQLNGKIVFENGLAEETGGWDESRVAWRYQGPLNLSSGKNTLSLLCDTAIPHIESIAIVTEDIALIPDVNAMQGDNESGIAEIDGNIWFRFKTSEFEGVTRAVGSLLSAGIDFVQVNDLIAGIVSSVERDRSNPQERIGFGGPMNGQRIRQQIFRHLDREAIFDAFVETGAYMGTTTEMLARYGRPVFACELNWNYYRFALSRLSLCKNVVLAPMDSRSFLRKFTANYDRVYKHPFFYLDAHWHDDLPLADEIEIICSSFKEFVIMVDDFRVPTSDYGYDRYSEENTLEFSYLERKVKNLDRYAVCFPSWDSETETGFRRGTLVMIPAQFYEAHFKSYRGLYRYN